MTEPTKKQVFGIDFEEREIIFFDGSRAKVETWYDPLGRECEPKAARAVTFQGDGGVWFALDLYSFHFPPVVH